MKLDKRDIYRLNTFFECQRLVSEFCFLNVPRSNIGLDGFNELTYSIGIKVDGFSMFRRINRELKNI